MLGKFPGLLLAVQMGWGGFLLTAQEAAPTTPPAPIEIFVDSKLLGATSSGWRIPASHNSVSLRLGKSAEEIGEASRRMRFKLEGVDNAWRQIPSEMCLMVRFGNAAGDQVGQQIFRVVGISPGWKGTIENSTFTPRREIVRVPAEGTFLTAAITSSGPPTAMGAYVVQGLKIVRSEAGRTHSVLEPIVSADQSEPPVGWSRSGTRPSMAKMVRAGSGGAFCIVDDDPNSHAEWHSSRAIAPIVQPGELLTVEWSEMYDIGMGNRFDVNYGRLGAGTYRFLANEEDATGLPQDPPIRVEFVVLQPIWKNPWFWCSGAVIGGLLLWLGGRAIIRAKIRQHLARAEQENLIERERLRIARDLHDDLGVRLTHISLVSGLAENDPQSAAAKESFQRISGMARDLVSALYQTVWTVNPENDHLEALVNFLGQLTQSLCETAGIRCRIYSCAVPSGRPLTSEIRHHITLAVKEAVHNAIKHAGATEITARIEFTEPHLRIAISDNGRGFDPATIAPGHGLANMRQRMESLGGTVSVENPAGAGSLIRFAVPIPTHAGKLSAPTLP